MNKETDISKLLENSILASPPDLLFKIINSLDSELSSRQIGEIIGHDQSISAQVLKLSNSSFFGFKGNIRTLDRAINILGTKTVRNIAVSTLLFTHTNRIRLYNLDIINFWLHTFLVADITREISQKAGLDGDESYIAGLLHAIGKLVLYSQRQPKTSFFKEEHTTEDILSYEKENWSVDSLELTAMLLEKWNIPEDIVMAVAEHNTPEGKTVLSKVVFLANEFASVVTDPYYRSSLSYPAFKKLLSETGITADDFSKLCVEIPGIVERGKNMMQIMASNTAYLVKKRLITKATIVTPHENSISKCLLSLMGFKVDIVHPEEVRAFEEAKKQKEKQEKLPDKTEEEKVKDAEKELPEKRAGFFSRLFGSKHEETESKETDTEQEQELELKPIDWQLLVLFEGCEPVQISRPNITVYKVSTESSEMGENSIPFFFSNIDIKTK